MNDINKRRTALGIEFGSTRVKAVLLGEAHEVLAAGVYAWENKLEGGYWTYSVEEIRAALGAAYAALKADVKEKYGVVLTHTGAIGISGMMHGYIALDKDDRLLVPFRTWRCGNAAAAAAELTSVFGYKIPARWTVAHLYQAILNGEPHVKSIRRLTTLAGYVHARLTGESIVGVGEGSGIFPIDLATGDYDRRLIAAFEGLPAVRQAGVTLQPVLPRVLPAGREAGRLTAAGARLLDPDGDLAAGIPFCPPEGDAGTGMVATGSVRRNTGNVSAGTSVFGMLVLEKDLKRVYDELDLVTTPSGDLVAMAHCNNCTSDINAWMGVFAELTALVGGTVTGGALYEKLFTKALEGDPDCGGVLAYNYLSGEHATHVENGRPMVVRTTERKFNLANLMRAHLLSAFATLKVGMDILTREEGASIARISGHGGIFKTKGVADRLLAAALNAPVSISKTANEGGPFGMAVLAAYMLSGAAQSLPDYLDEAVFKDAAVETAVPIQKDVDGFAAYMKKFIAGLAVERQAGKSL
ncbi:MAG: ATPase [Clostridiales bacterium]|nr:ATPase [Clostridiales bacterium]